MLYVKVLKVMIYGQQAFSMYPRVKESERMSGEAADRYETAPGIV